MTGFGLASTDHESVKFSVEIKSLNSKFLELGLKIPKAFSDKELYLRNLCNKEIERGKVSIAITVERSEETQKGASINEILLKQYYNQLIELNKSLGANIDNLLPTVLNLPEVITYTEEEASESEWKVLESTFAKALKNFNQFRLDEGAILKADLELRIKNIMGFFAEVAKLAPLRIPNIKNRLTQFLEDTVGKVNYDQNRFEQELIYYIDKLDITEEQTRLKSHCDYFIETLKDKDANGKKLGFISQEIGREINTMGSKANDAQIQQLVVGMKEELEKIKEQLLNVL
ncbi:YicC/YloC family endoribonuclease [Nubsella zeaxanthinifaciens]|uniref:YicC/YloC family endoribonuclease n=1 Tax=Nubsella zeaxanthinifaciens TaxID=392412 RepID=UPI000DE43B94|nr:YicC/YloC family endoribonuclease [Nubsella zeaxanthinifaciens]